MLTGLFANILHQLKTTELRLQKKSQSRPNPSNGGKKDAREEEGSHWSARPVTSSVSSHHHRVHSSLSARSVVSSFLPKGSAHTSQSAPKALASPPDHTSPSGTQTPEQGHPDLTSSEALSSSQEAQHRGLGVSGLPGQNSLPVKIAQVKVSGSPEMTTGAACQNSGLRKA